MRLSKKSARTKPAKRRRFARVLPILLSFVIISAAIWELACFPRLACAAAEDYAIELRRILNETVAKQLGLTPELYQIPLLGSAKVDNAYQPVMIDAYQMNRIRQQLFTALEAAYREAYAKGLCTTTDSLFPLMPLLAPGFRWSVTAASAPWLTAELIQSSAQGAAGQEYSICLELVVHGSFVVAGQRSSALLREEVLLAKVFLRQENLRWGW